MSFIVIPVVVIGFIELLKKNKMTGGGAFAEGTEGYIDIEILLNVADIDKLVDLCSSNKGFDQLCKTPQFWERWTKKYGQDILKKKLDKSAYYSTEEKNFLFDFKMLKFLSTYPIDFLKPHKWEYIVSSISKEIYQNIRNDPDARMFINNLIKKPEISLNLSSLLYDAIKHDDTKLSDLIISYRPRYISTALNAAASNDKYSYFKNLLEKYKEGIINNPTDDMIRIHNQTIIERVIDHSLKYSKPKYLSLYLEAFRNHYDKNKIEFFYFLNDKNFTTNLGWVKVDILLKNGVTIKDLGCYKLLHRAIIDNNIKIATQVLKECSISDFTKTIASPLLDIAAENANVEMVKLLLAYGLKTITEYKLTQLIDDASTTVNDINHYKQEEATEYKLAGDCRTRFINNNIMDLNMEDFEYERQLNECDDEYLYFKRMRKRAEFAFANRHKFIEIIEILLKEQIPQTLGVLQRLISRAKGNKNNKLVKILSKYSIRP